MQKIIEKTAGELNRLKLNYHDFTQFNQALKILTKKEREILLNWIDENGIKQFKDLISPFLK